MLSSVTDLLRYIDENQLTSEFGGTLDYCHSDWIVLRTVHTYFQLTYHQSCSDSEPQHKFYNMSDVARHIQTWPVCLHRSEWWCQSINVETLWWRPYVVCSLAPLQAIESFAVTVKDIAQMLQAFGTELAETKLPAEGTAIMRLLSTHTDKYRKLKVYCNPFYTIEVEDSSLYLCHYTVCGQCHLK